MDTAWPLSPSERQRELQLARRRADGGSVGHSPSVGSPSIGLNLTPRTGTMGSPSHVSGAGLGTTAKKGSLPHTSIRYEQGYSNVAAFNRGSASGGGTGVRRGLGGSQHQSGAAGGANGSGALVTSRAVHHSPTSSTPRGWTSSVALKPVPCSKAPTTNARLAKTTSDINAQMEKHLNELVSGRQRVERGQDALSKEYSLLIRAINEAENVISELQDHNDAHEELLHEFLSLPSIATESPSRRHEQQRAAELQARDAHSGAFRVGMFTLDPAVVPRQHHRRDATKRGGLSHAEAGSAAAAARLGTTRQASPFRNTAASNTSLTRTQNDALGPAAGRGPPAATKSSAVALRQFSFSRHVQEAADRLLPRGADAASTAAVAAAAGTSRRDATAFVGLGNMEKALQFGPIILQEVAFIKGRIDEARQVAEEAMSAHDRLQHMGTLLEVAINIDLVCIGQRTDDGSVAVNASPAYPDMTIDNLPDVERSAHDLTAFCSRAAVEMRKTLQSARAGQSEITNALIAAMKLGLKCAAAKYDECMRVLEGIQHDQQRAQIALDEVLQEEAILEQRHAQLEKILHVRRTALENSVFGSQAAHAAGHSDPVMLSLLKEVKELGVRMEEVQERKVQVGGRLHQLESEAAEVDRQAEEAKVSTDVCNRIQQLHERD